MGLTYQEAMRLGIPWPEDMPKTGGGKLPVPVGLDLRPKTQTLTIENWHPTKTNQIIGSHWAKGARLKRADKELLAGYCRIYRIAPAAMKRRVTLAITFSGRGRLPDPDAFWKSTLDALSLCGAIRGDGPNDVELMPVTITRGPAKRTVIVLEDISLVETDR